MDSKKAAKQAIRDSLQDWPDQLDKQGKPIEGTYPGNEIAQIVAAEEAALEIDEKIEGPHNGPTIPSRIVKKRD